MATSSATAPGLRARNRAAIEREILVVAREQLARHGAAALSLRAVARELGMVSSALYRYVTDRDELLTRLIVEAYTALAEHVRRAHDDIPPTDVMGRWSAIAHAVRSWALARPHEYALLYGSPVPDYDAPADRTNDAGTRVLALVVTVLADAARSGRLARDGFATHLTEDLDPLAVQAAGPLLEDEFLAGTGLDVPTVLAGLAAWSLVMGALSSEVFGALGDQTVHDPDAWFDYMTQVAGRLVLLP